MTQEFQKLWLKVTAVVVGSFGPVFLLATMPGSAGPARLAVDLLKWPIDGTAHFEHPDTWFLSALAGGFLMGWAALIWCLAIWVHDAAPEAVRRCVVFSLVVWFVCDSLGSVLSGTASNVVFNFLVLAVAIGPLWRPAERALAAE